MSGGLLLPRVAARLFDTPLMVDAGKAVSMLLGLGARVVDGGVVLVGDIEPTHHAAFEGGRILAGVVGDGMGRAVAATGRLPYALVDHVAIIPVEGTLVHKGAFLGQSSGETSYQGLMTQIAHAARNPQVKGVVFEVDSYGGEVAGSFQAASMIADLSAAKPTMAILTDHALSAGYLMAAPARQVVMPPLGAAGSIGTLVIHRDMSGAMEKQGAVLTLIHSGAHKVDGNPVSPLADEARAQIQARVDAGRDHFAGAVGQYRGRRLTKAQALATEAQVYIGKDAQDAGLVDAIAPANDAFSAFVQAVNKAG